MDYEFLGIGFNKEQMQNWKDKFDIIEYGDSLALVSKEQFNHGEDEGFMNGLKYRYVVIGENADYGETVEDENGEEVSADCYSLYLEPEIDQVADNTILAVAELYGMEDMPMEELRKELTVVDLTKEDYGVFLGSVNKKSLTYEDGEIWDSETLNVFATVMGIIDSLRGFYLDKPLNRVGMTGWDWLEMTVTDKQFGDIVKEYM